MVTGLLALGVGLNVLIPYVVPLDKIKNEALVRVNTEVLPAITHLPDWQADAGELTVRLGWTGVTAQLNNIRVLKRHSPNRLKVAKATAVIRYWPAIVGGKPELSHIQLERCRLRLLDPLAAFTQQSQPSLTKTTTTTSTPASTNVSSQNLSQEGRSQNKSDLPFALNDTIVTIKGYHVVLGPWVRQFVKDLHPQVTAVKLFGNTASLTHVVSKQPMRVAFHVMPAFTTQPYQPGSHRSGRRRHWQTVVFADVDAALPQWVTAKLPATTSSSSPNPTRPFERVFVDLRRLDLDRLAAMLDLRPKQLAPQGTFRRILLDIHPALWGGDDARLWVKTAGPVQVQVKNQTFKLPSGAAELAAHHKNNFIYDHIKLLLQSQPYTVEASGRIQFPEQALNSVAANIFTSAKAMPKEKTPSSSLNPVLLPWLTRLDQADMDFKVKTSLLPVNMLTFLPKTSPAGAIVHQSQGYFQLDTQFKGTLKHPTLNGTVAVKDWQSLKAIRQTNGTVTLRQTQVAFDKLQGQFFNTPFQLNGAFDWKQNRYAQAGIQARRLNLTEAQQFYRQVAVLMKKPLPPPLQKIQLSGLADVDLAMDGPVKAPAVNGTLGLHQVSVVMTPSQKPVIRNLTAPLTFNGQTIAFDQLTLLLNQQFLKAQGHINWQKQQLNTAIRGDGLSLAALNEWNKTVSTLFEKKKWPIKTARRLNRGDRPNHLEFVGVRAV